MTPTNGHTVVLVDAELERLLVAAVLRDPSCLDKLREFAVADLADFQAVAAFAAVRNVQAAGKVPTPAAVRAHLAAELLQKDPERPLNEHPQAGDLVWFDRLVATDVPADPPVIGWSMKLLDLAIIRAAAVEAAEEVQREQDEITATALRDAEPTPRPHPPWFRGPELVDEILRHVDEPWILLTTGGEELCRIRAGGIAVIMGGSGSGKSSLTSGFLVEHALHVGPAIALSIELPAEELGGRIVGMRCDASWEEALRGLVRREFMVDALELPRLYVIDQENATLTNLERAIDAARTEYPGEPILIAIDYAQLLESKEREVRMQVTDAFKRINRITRGKRVVCLAVSQMSRAAAKQARDGEKIGADSADGGAESAAVERFATLTLSIGAASEPRPDGSRAVEVSLGKGRMSGGDRVFPMTYWGKTGRWRMVGEAVAAENVRGARDTERTAKLQQSLEHALLGAAMKSPEPLAREELAEQVQGRNAYKRSAIACLVARGDLVEVQKKRIRSKTWSVWTPERAVAAGMKLVRDMEDYQ